MKLGLGKCKKNQEKRNKIGQRAGLYKLPIKSAIKFDQIIKDRSNRNISIYLLTHSLELMLKGLYIEKTGKILYTHKISDVYKQVKCFVEPHTFDTNKLEELFLKLDEILIWAGRYPAPKKFNNKARNYNNSIMNFAKTSLGLTADISTALRVDYNHLLYDFHNHMAGLIKSNQSAQHEEK